MFPCLSVCLLVLGVEGCSWGSNQKGKHKTMLPASHPDRHHEEPSVTRGTSPPRAAASHQTHPATIRATSRPRRPTTTSKHLRRCRYRCCWVLPVAVLFFLGGLPVALPEFSLGLPGLSRGSPGAYLGYSGGARQADKQTSRKENRQADRQSGQQTGRQIG